MYVLVLCSVLLLYLLQIVKLKEHEKMGRDEGAGMAYWEGRRYGAMSRCIRWRKGLTWPRYPSARYVSLVDTVLIGISLQTPSVSLQTLQTERSHWAPAGGIQFRCVGGFRCTRVSTVLSAPWLRATYRIVLAKAIPIDVFILLSNGLLNK